MKKLISFIIILAVFLQVFINLSIFASYQINKEYIAEHLCINKSKPQMHCNGKCHLKKQLQKSEEKQQAPVSLRNFTEVILYCNENRIDFIKPMEHYDLLHGINWSLPCQMVATAIFHPPKFC